jgi:hypothetical protein
MDTAPGPRFENGSAISDDDEAWFVVERIGIPSQYFMASAPQHPLMHLLVTVTLRRLLEVPNVGEQYVPFVTGPGALKEAWQHFIYHYPKETGEDLTEEGRSGFGTSPESNLGIVDEADPRRRLLENTTEVKIDTDEPLARRVGLEGGVYIGMMNWTVTIAGHRGVRIYRTAQLDLGRKSTAFVDLTFLFSGCYYRILNNISTVKQSRRRKIIGNPSV